MSSVFYNFQDNLCYFRVSSILGSIFFGCVVLATPVLTQEPVTPITLTGGETIKVDFSVSTNSQVAIQTSGGKTKVEIAGAGSISTIGNYAHGIRNDGSSNMAAVEGSISTDGQSASAIINNGSNNTTDITGTVITKSYGYGIYNNGSNNKTTISGKITTENTGVNNNGSQNYTTLAGAISTKGAVAHGVWNRASNNVTTISTAGSISTIGGTANGIRNGGSSNMATVEGSISTGGQWASAIINNGSNNTTDIAGSILTQGDFANGIHNVGNKNQTSISQSGKIIATGGGSSGVINSGNQNVTYLLGTLATWGKLTTYEDDAYPTITRYADGINNEGSNNKTTLASGASISTSGHFAHGVRNKGSGNSIAIATGASISTNGIYSPGVSYQGSGNATNIYGSITTTNNSSGGIIYGGSNNITTIFDSGAISTNSDSSPGVYNVGSGNTVTVSGGISTNGNYSQGIANVGNNNTTSVYGKVVTQETDAFGIVNAGDKNKTIVSGRIFTKGGKSYGVYNKGSGNKTTVSGSISTTGVGGSAIVNEGGTDNTSVTSENISNKAASAQTNLSNKGSDGNSSLSGSKVGAGALASGSKSGNNETTVSGSVFTTGTSAHGIVNDSDGNIATITGVVSSTGSGSHALHNESGSGNHFILNEGATITGHITASNATTNNKLSFNTNQSYDYSVGGAGTGNGLGQWTIEDNDDGTHQTITTVDESNCSDAVDDSNNLYISTCHRVTGVTLDNVEVQDELQYLMNRSLIGSLRLNRLSYPIFPDKSSMVLLKNSVWADVYGDKTEGDATKSRAIFSGSNAGITIGVPTIRDGALNMDVLLNTSNAKLDLGLNKNQDFTVQSYNVGAVFYDLIPSKNWSVNAFGFLGYNGYKRKRKVFQNTSATAINGFNTVEPSYSAKEFLVGLDAQYSKSVNEFFVVNFGVNSSLSYEKIGAHSGDNYASWDARKMTQAVGGISVDLEYRKDQFKAFAAFGAEHTSLVSGKTTSYTYNGTNRSYTDSNTDDTFGSIAVGFGYDNSENVSLKGAFEAFSSQDGISGYSANLGIFMTF